jgi:hypothetical protein
MLSFQSLTNFQADQEHVIYTMRATTDKEHGLVTSPILVPSDNYNMFSTSKQLKDDNQNL